MSSLSVPRDAVGVCLLGDRLYAVGGYDGQSYLNTVESYDAQNNEWTEVIIRDSYVIHLTYYFVIVLEEEKKVTYYDAYSALKNFTLACFCQTL